MKFNQLLAVGLAILSGIQAAKMANDYLESERGKPAVKVVPAAMTTVVATAKSLTRGRLLRKADLKQISWPVDSVPDGAYRTISQLLGGSSKRMTLSNFASGEVVTKMRVSGNGARPSLSHMLGKGMRAVAVKVNAVVGVGGFVSPGDRVDLLLTESSDADTGKEIVTTKVLLQDVRVLAIDQQTEDPEYRPKVASTVTLEARLGDAQKIALAAKLGSITLALRSMGQTGDDAHAALSTAKLEDDTSPEKTIVVYRASKPTQYNVPNYSPKHVQ
ncbi:MAG: Flp pilus assembly protein CpaB [Hyphomicrobiaceae bacterium]